MVPNSMFPMTNTKGPVISDARCLLAWISEETCRQWAQGEQEVFIPQTLQLSFHCALQEEETLMRQEKGPAAAAGA